MDKINIRYNIREYAKAGSFDLIFDKESVGKLGQELVDTLSDYEVYEVIEGEYFTMNVSDFEDAKLLFEEIEGNYDNLIFSLDKSIEFSKEKYPFYYALEDDSEIGEGTIILYVSNRKDFDKDNHISDNFNLKLIDYLENLGFIQLAESTFESPNKKMEELKAILHSSEVFDFKENEQLLAI